METVDIQAVKEYNNSGIEKGKINKNLNNVPRVDENLEIPEPANDIGDNALNV